jgi:hypothetical protein
VGEEVEAVDELLQEEVVQQEQCEFRLSHEFLLGDLAS